jgi:hypothetical protein
MGKEEKLVEKIDENSNRNKFVPLRLRRSSFSLRGVQQGVSKRVEDGRRMPAFRVAMPETAVRPFQVWLSTGRRRVGHGMGLSDNIGSAWLPLAIRPFYLSHQQRAQQEVSRFTMYRSRLISGISL